jgi:hypothetical protein
MLLRKVIFILPLVTVAVTVLNSSGFVFLAADERLPQYIVNSTVFSLIVWATHWIVPSAFNFNEEKLPDIRLLQWLFAALGVILFNALSPNWISAAFSFALIAEVFFFHSGILVIHSRTATFHLLEVGRGVLNLLNLLCCIFLFGGAPSFLVLGMGVNVVIVGIISYQLGNRAPAIPASSFSRSALARVTHSALASRNTRLMILARCLEITTVFALTLFENLSALIAVKLAAMIAQAVSLHSRSASWFYIILITTVFSASALVTVIELNASFPGFLPDALQTLTWSGLFVAIVFQLPFSFLLYQSLIKRKDQVDLVGKQ